MKKSLLLLGFALFLGSSSVYAQEEITLEKIMQHPRWIGNWAEEVRFGPDGRSLFYLAHADPRGYEAIEINLNGDVVEVHDTNGLPSELSKYGESSVYEFKGDLFLGGSHPGRLTRTLADESLSLIHI